MLRPARFSHESLHRYMNKREVRLLELTLMLTVLGACEEGLPVGYRRPHEKNTQYKKPAIPSNVRYQS